MFGIADIPEDARKYIMNLIIKGRFAEEEKQDTYEVETVQVVAKAET